MGKGVMTDAVVALKRVSELKRQGGEKNEELIRDIIKTHFGQMGLALYNRLSAFNVPPEKIVSMMQDMASKMERFGKRIEKAIKEKRLKAAQAEKEAVAKQQAQIAAAQKEAVERQKRLDEAQKFFEELRAKRKKLLADKDKHLANKKRAGEDRQKAENDVNKLDKEDKLLADKEKKEKNAQKREEYRRKRAKIRRDKDERMKFISACRRREQEALRELQALDSQIASADKDLKSAQQKRDVAKVSVEQAKDRLAQLRGQNTPKQPEVADVKTPQATQTRVVVNTQQQTR